MINRVILRGYVAEDPYIRATENGKLAKLRVATIERIKLKRDGAITEHTEWHTISLWGENADLADKRIRIGSTIEIEGALRTRDWEDSKGKQHRTTEIVASKLKIIEEGVEGYKLPRPIVEKMDILYPTKKIEPQSQYEIKAPAEDPDDLPF